MAVSKVVDTESWSNTHFEEVNITHKWTIDHFRHRQESVGEAIESSTFSAVADGTKCSWCLRLYPMGDGAEVKVNGDKHFTREGSEEFKTGKVSGFRSFISRDTVLTESKGCLQNGKLTIVCDLTLLEDSITISGEEYKSELNEPYEDLSHDLGQLFENNKFSDVTLSVGGREIQAHKNILAVRSPVFAAMFEEGWKEGKQNKIDIVEIKYMVLKEMLRFIYTAEVDDLEDSSEELLEAAERYQLEGLKEICEEALCGNLSVENAADYLILADLHRADRLKNRAIAFVNKHAKDVKKTPGWKSLYTSHPHLLADAWMNLMSVDSSEEETKRDEPSVP